MTEREFDPAAALGEQLASMDRQALCELAIGLCRLLEKEGGTESYHGGVYPENIRREETGELAVGPGRLSGWDGQELQFIPPELYWDGEAGPAGDVYSLGLLLYYGLSGGKLPLEGESPNAQLSRVSGQSFSAPAAAGLRLGEIVTKACAYKAAERFATVRELRIMLESCEENKYLSENAGEELFRKNEEELSEAERLMLAILGGEPAEPVEAEAPLEDVPEESAPLEELSEEEAAALILGGPGVPAETGEDSAAARQALVEEVFGENKPEPSEEADPGETEESGAEKAEEPGAGESGENEPEKRPETPPVVSGDTTRIPDEKEDVRVYEPAREKKDHVPIPILTEEKNPELAPITVSRLRPASFGQDEERSRQIAQNVKKRRTRPIGVVLILCSLLIFAALFANRYLRSYEWEDEGRGREITMPDVGENAISTENSFITADELQQQTEAAQPKQSYYQIFAGDLSWTMAKNACTDLGGILAVINTQDEFTMVTQLAQNSGVKGVWVGCHRENGFLQWETEEPVGTMSWADNEPSYTDYRDGAAEDYVMLWNTGDGWAYIDCRNDPVYADPNVYSGVIGYVCEFEN